MTRKLISTGSPFERVAGYSRAVVQGDWCFVAGTTGYDYDAMAMPEDPVDQVRNAMKTIKAALEEAGFSLEDVVRARYVITRPEDVDVVFPAVGEFFADIRPAATMTVGPLVKPEMLFEADVTAFRG